MKRMKKYILASLLLAFVTTVSAQSFRYGYFSYDAVLKAMTAYTVAEKNLSDLRAQYEQEAKRAGDDFNKKYEDFLDVQRDLAPTIRQKRQAELVDLMEKNSAFQKEAERLMRQAENDAMTPLYRRIDDAAARLGRERGYAFILNTDNHNLPYADPTMGEDVTEVVKDYIE